MAVADLHVLFNATLIWIGLAVSSYGSVEQNQVELVRILKDLDPRSLDEMF
jgi:hypothetical protein